MLPTKFRLIWQSGFRGGDLKILANQKQELPVVAMCGNGSLQNVHSLERTFHRCFLLSFSSFGWWVSEEKIKMWKVNRWHTTNDGHQVLQKHVQNITSRKLLETAIHNIWTEILIDYIQDLYKSMPKHLKQVIKAKGGITVLGRWICFY